MRRKILRNSLVVEEMAGTETEGRHARVEVGELVQSIGDSD